MIKLFLIRSNTQFLARICTLHPVVGIICVVSGFFYLAIWDANQSSQAAQRFEQEMALRRQIEFDREAEHRRQLEIVEALKPRRDLTLPAEPEEAF